MRASVLVALVAAACGSPGHGHDAGPDIGDVGLDAYEGVGFVVAGSAVGIREPSRFVLAINGQPDQSVWITEDGPFRYPRRLADGTSFSIQPSGAQACDPDPFAGTIQSADVNAAVVCDGVVDLASVGFSIAVRLHPQFDPRASAYTGDQPRLLEPSDTMTTTATATNPTTNVAIMSSPTTMDTALRIDLSHGALSHGYTFVLRREVVEEATLRAPDATPNASLGGASFNGVAISGDTVAVGAPSVNKVYLFKRSGQTWMHQATLQGPASSGFGTSVALDGTTLVIGAPTASSGVGAAYTSTWNGTTWPAAAALSASPPASAGFGTAVTIAGSYLAIGAPGQSGTTGSVSIYKNMGGWTLDQTVSRGTNGNFGRAVSLSGTKLAVGAPVIDKAYVLAGPSWTDDGTLSGTANTRFGDAVSMDGTLLAVGAPRADVSTAGFAGVVQLFRYGTTWALEKTINATAYGANDEFGAHVAVDREHVIVGARREDCGGQGIEPPCSSTRVESGAVFVFRKTTDWVQDRYIKASNAEANDRFGTGVAVDYDTFVTAAPSEDGANNTLMDSGAVYVFR